MERYTKFAPGEYYHIYNRGVNKDKIFYSEGDWKYFQRLLYIRNDKEGHIKPSRAHNLKLHDIERVSPLVNIQAYALMPNHFHLLVSEQAEGGITMFMKRLLTSYSMYMNKKYDRSGPLMCRPFRSRHIDSDEYMRWVISYIHLNSLDILQPEWKEKGVQSKSRAEKHIRDYQYSSYRDYFIEDRDESAILNKSSLPFFISDLENIQSMLATSATYEFNS